MHLAVVFKAQRENLFVSLVLSIVNVFEYKSGLDNGCIISLEINSLNCPLGSIPVKAILVGMKRL